jgi:hypothetical protein
LTAFGISIAGGYAHSLKSAVYEFHKSEYFYYVGKYDTNRVPYAEEVKLTYKRDTFFQKFVYYSYLDYCRKQEKAAFRPPVIREQLKKFAFNERTRVKFLSLYEPLNQRMLFWWAWTGGSNVQRNAMLVAILVGFVEVYLVANFLSLVVHFAVGSLQKRSDEQLLNAFKSN